MAREMANFMEQLIKRQNDLFSKSVINIVDLLSINKIDYRVYTEYNPTGLHKINLIILSKKYIPNFIQKRAVKKLVKGMYFDLLESTRIKCFYSGDVIIHYTKVSMPSHPMCESYMSKAPLDDKAPKIF